MPPLTEADRTRLVAVCGMLGSAYDGERAAAALKANRLVRSAGLVWDDVISPVLASPAQLMDRADAEQLCAHYAEFLTPWEQALLTGIRRYHRLSQRQSETLAGIAKDVQARARA